MNKAILTSLKKVMDPELRVSIVDLGLIYGAEQKGDMVVIDMTLTTPFCPMAPEIEQDMRRTIKQDLKTEKIEINLVWDPPWDASEMASDEIKDALGLW